MQVDLVKENPLLNKFELDKRYTLQEIIEEYPKVKDQRRIVAQDNSRNDSEYRSSEYVLKAH